MVSVPSLALFSHHLPAGLPAAAGRLLIAPAVGWIASWRGATASALTTRTSGVEPLVEVDVLASTTPAISATDQADIRRRLRAAGAVAVECHALPGDEVEHLATARVALDADGQLQRVFQATGHDSLAAHRRLLEEITAWRRRRTVWK